MKVILVSGTPATGKTAYAKKLAKEKGYKYIDVNRLIAKYNLSEGMDRKRNSKIIDTEKLNRVLIEVIDKEKKKQKGIVIDSHLSHYLPSDYADLCIITKCSLPTLKKRLQKRGYSENKIRENLDAEIFDTCASEAMEIGHKIEIVYTE
jgi:adenylate kinase